MLRMSRHDSAPPINELTSHSFRWPDQESEAGELVMSNTCRLTSSQLDEFLRRSLDKYKRALVEPGEASVSRWPPPLMSNDQKTVKVTPSRSECLVLFCFVVLQ